MSEAFLLFLITNISWILWACAHLAISHGRDFSDSKTEVDENG